MQPRERPKTDQKGYLQRVDLGYRKDVKRVCLWPLFTLM